MKYKILDIETTGLNPIEDRIICIGMLNIDDNHINMFSGEDETKLLKEFWDYIENDPYIHIYTFNGDSFDFPFIVKRSLINNIKIQMMHGSDLRRLVNCWKLNPDKYVKGSLRDWAKILDCDINTQDGSHMLELFKKGDWNNITKHCEEDLHITKALYDRCCNCNLIK